ncbi:MAG: hypothetical protein M3Z96_03225 [Pseudomonadota bacterium]|nr:hypothetical protein [Pseudomonadota bacterium]
MPCWLVKADDLAMETVAVNMPGTGKERPNWRRKLRVPVQTLFALGSAQAVLEEVRRKAKGRPAPGKSKLPDRWR